MPNLALIADSKPEVKRSNKPKQDYTFKSTVQRFDGHLYKLSSKEANDGSIKPNYQSVDPRVRGIDMSAVAKNKSKAQYIKVPPCCLEKAGCSYHTRVKAKQDSPQKAQTNVVAEKQFHTTWGLTNTFKEDGKDYDVKFENLGVAKQINLQAKANLAINRNDSMVNSD